MGAAAAADKTEALHTAAAAAASDKAWTNASFAGFQGTLNGGRQF
jgi:hypothetical protein